MIYISNRRNNQEELVNDNIRFREVLVIGPKGEQLGIMRRDDALAEAHKQELDLYCVSPTSKPPVCKILDYGKHRYEAQKRAQEQRRNQKVQETKTMRLSPVIDVGDLNTKIRQTRSWLEAGMKVNVDMRFRGRLITRQDVGREVMNEFIEALSDVAQVEKRPSMDGYMMNAVLGPKSKK